MARWHPDYNWISHGSTDNPGTHRTVSVEVQDRRRRIPFGFTPKPRTPKGFD